VRHKYDSTQTIIKPDVAALSLYESDDAGIMNESFGICVLIHGIRGMNYFLISANNHVNRHPPTLQ
jgi:hypothetical protein